MRYAAKVPHPSPVDTSTYPPLSPPRSPLRFARKYARHDTGAWLQKRAQAAAPVFVAAFVSALMLRHYWQKAVAFAASLFRKADLPAGPRGWTPLNLTNLYAWYDPSNPATVTKSETEVTQLLDKSSRSPVSRQRLSRR